jgi:AGCS family alanine or glycine:cation symporter
MAVAFALFASIAGFGIGNMVQANSIANALNANFAIPEWLTGIVLVVLVGAVLLGGIERISTVAGKLVPIMAIAYMAAGTLVLALNVEAIPAAFSLIFPHAFTPTAATGGFAGAAVWAAIRFGVARGVFSNKLVLGQPQSRMWRPSARVRSVKASSPCWAHSSIPLSFAPSRRLHRRMDKR